MYKSKKNIKEKLFLFGRIVLTTFSILTTFVSSAQSIAAGCAHSVSLCNDTVMAWGWNMWGQLGDNKASGNQSNVPLKVLGGATGNTYLTGISSVAAGYHTIALRNDGTVWNWGLNNFGQLGDNSTINRSTPVQVSPTWSGSIVKIAAGQYHSLAIKNDGTVWAWGWNLDGQLGDNTGIDRHTPVQVIGLTGVTDISGGGGHSIALKSDGTVWTWGINWSGQIGDNTTISRYSPVQVAGLTGIIDVASQGPFSLALKNDGTVWAWGYNNQGQLGDNTTIDKHTPVQVSGLSGIVSVATGEYHSIAVKNDGTVWNWGWNNWGQLGDNTASGIRSSIPVQVIGLSGIVTVSGGGGHSLAIKNDGTIWAWGDNGQGQIGDNTIADRHIPVQVNILCSVSSLSVSVTSATICAGSCATLTASPGGGTAPYFYSWSPSGQTTQAIIVCPTSTTTYTVLITDSNNSTVTGTTGVTLNPSPVASITGSSTICAGSITTITASGGGTYLWNTAASAYAIIVSPAVTSTYSVIVYIGSCSDTAYFALTVTPLPVAAISGSTTICIGSSATLTASGGGTYNWNTGATTTSIYVSPTISASYTVQVTNGACSANAVATVSVTSTITASISGNTSLCAGSNTTLTASGGSTFLWSSGETTASITISPAANTTYSVTTASSSCTDDTSITIIVNPLPIPTVSSSSTICSGDSQTLTASGGTNYSWSPSGQTGTGTTITVTPTTTTNYTVTVTDANGCSNATTTLITVSPSVTAGVSPSSICMGESAQLTATGGGTYSWNTGSTNASITVYPTSTSTYTVLVTNGLCSDTATVAVTVNPTPTAGITSQPAGQAGNVTITSGSSTVLTASGGGTYSWYPSTGLSCITCANPTLTAPSFGAQGGLLYCVTVTNANNCADTACITVTVDFIDCSNTGELYLPNAFSPNGDGENDFLQVYYGNINCIKTFKLVIYDRWGSKVFQTTDPAFLWDGTNQAELFKGTALETAVLVYYMNATMIDGEKISKKGNISLVR